MDSTVQAILADAEASRAKWGNYRSLHEAYGVLAEEMAELFDAVRADDTEGARREAIQIAACAYKLARYGWVRTNQRGNRPARR